MIDFTKIKIHPIHYTDGTASILIYCDVCHKAKEPLDKIYFFESLEVRSLKLINKAARDHLRRYHR